MKIKKFWKIYVVWLVISIALGVGIFLGFYLGNNKSMQGALNGTSFSGIILLCLAGLCIIGREGFFDIFAYGFKQMGAMIFTKDPNSLKDFPGYKEDKKNIRKFGSKYYYVIAIVGLLFMIAFVILRIKASSMY